MRPLRYSTANTQTAPPAGTFGTSFGKKRPTRAAQIQLGARRAGRHAGLASDEDVIGVHGAVKALFQDAETDAERGAIAAVVVDGELHRQPCERARDGES